MHTHTAIYHISTYLHIYYIHIYIYIYIYIPPGFSPSHDFYKIGVPPQCHVYSLDKNGNFFFFKPFMVALTLRWFCARKGVGYLEGFCASFPPVSLSRSLSLPNTNFWLCMSCRKSLFGFPPTVLEMESGIPSLSGPTGIYCSRVHSHSTSSGVASRMCASALERPVA